MEWEKTLRVLKKGGTFAIHDIFSKMILLIDFAPVNTKSQSLFQEHIEPDTCRSPIPFHKRVCDIHLNIFIHYLIVIIFGHILWTDLSRKII